MKSEKERIRRAPLAQLMSWWGGDVPDSAESRIRFRIAVGKALKKTPEGLAFLKEQLDSADLGKRIRAVLELTRGGIIEPEILDNLLAAFAADEIELKYYALHCLTMLKRYVLSREAVEHLFNHPELLHGEMAREAMLYLARAYPEDAVSLLKRGLQSEIRCIRGAACAEVGEKLLYELQPDVERLKSDPEWYVSTSAHNAIDYMRLIEEWTRRQSHK